MDRIVLRYVIRSIVVLVGLGVFIWAVMGLISGYWSMGDWIGPARALWVALVLIVGLPVVCAIWDGYYNHKRALKRAAEEEAHRERMAKFYKSMK